MPNPDDFEYLADMSEQELWEEVRYADRHGLDELAKACRGRLGIRDKSDDFLFVSFGNIGEPEESEESEDEQAEDAEAPRCDAEITPIDGDTSYAATRCGRVVGHAPEKRSGRIEHQSYVALARKRKGSIRADKSNDFHGNVDLPKPEFAPGDEVFHPVHGQGHVTRNDGGRIRVMWHGIGGIVNDVGEGSVDL